MTLRATGFVTARPLVTVLAAAAERLAPDERLTAPDLPVSDERETLFLLLVDADAALVFGRLLLPLVTEVTDLTDLLLCVLEKRFTDRERFF